RGILLADTKFEFGTDADGRLYVMDEMLTPDSSRYWPADEYEVGTSPPSYDKQIVRDYLETLDWDKTPPGRRLPPEVIERTRPRTTEVVQALERMSIDEASPPDARAARRCPRRTTCTPKDIDERHRSCLRPPNRPLVRRLLCRPPQPDQPAHPRGRGAVDP